MKVLAATTTTDFLLVHLLKTMQQKIQTTNMQKTQQLQTAGKQYIFLSHRNSAIEKLVFCSLSTFFC